jgi:hypothetical protein
MTEGNGVQKAVLGERFGVVVSVFVVLGCVKLGEPLCTKVQTTFVQSGAIRGILGRRLET